MPSDSTSKAQDQSIFKEGRKQCHKARDEFFKCVADAGVVFSLDSPIPKECLKHRKAYEESCKASWVRHFDISQDKELRILKTLRTNINTAAATATGGLQGTDHRGN